MESKYVDVETLEFFMFDVFATQKLFELERFSDYDRESTRMMLQAAKDLGDNYLHPIYTKMDREKAVFRDGVVKVLPELKTAIKAVAEAGWINAMYDFEQGGQQLPYSILNAALYIFYAANPNATPYATLTQGAANLIYSFGSEELKSDYLEKMSSWDWQGTMALTEPDAGSSLSDLTSMAVPQEDGSYRVQGQKIYISGGDHDAVENVIHLLLARTPGAPQGTKGISLFVVPKYRKEGENWVFNDVKTSGIYGKMGQKGYVAAHLMLGESEDCHAYLVGDLNKGLSYMFQMMNEARIGTGTLAAATSSAAYYQSLQYAKERKQGRHPGTKDPSTPPVPIIEHADIKRLLLFQKSSFEGALGLICYCDYLKDLSEFGEEESRENHHLLLELLTPVVKSYASESGFLSVNSAMQILGGAGYTDDFPVEQYLRDTRVNSIYEGTTAIHGMDLLGRKMVQKGGIAVQLFGKEMQSTIQKALEYNELKPIAGQLAERINAFSQVTQSLQIRAQKEGPRSYLSDASLFLEYFSFECALACNLCAKQHG